MTQLNRLFERLRDANIEFVIVGGFAGMLHGSALVTRDLDVRIVLSADTVARLRDVFRDLRPQHRLATQKLSFLNNPKTSSNSRQRKKNTSGRSCPGSAHEN